MSTWGDILRSAGLSVIDTPGPGVEGDFTPQGIMLHHTGGYFPEDLRILTEGTQALEGPWVQIYVAPDSTTHILTEGRAYHAGAGSYSDDGFTVPTDQGNSLLIGIEASHIGDSPISGPQYSTILTTAAALCEHYGWDEKRVLLHRSYAPTRKIDIRNDLTTVQSDIKALLEGGNGTEMALTPEDKAWITSQFVWQNDNLNRPTKQNTEKILALITAAVVPALNKITTLLTELVNRPEEDIDYERIAQDVNDEQDARDRERLGPSI